MAFLTFSDIYLKPPISDLFFILRQLLMISHLSVQHGFSYRLQIRSEMSVHI